MVDNLQARQKHCSNLDSKAMMSLRSSKMGREGYYFVCRQQSSKQKISQSQWPTGLTAPTTRTSGMNLLDPAVQARIEQSIAQTNINHNLTTALDLHPESFAPVSMLYVALRVNNTELTAFVDCGAQATIMSLKCAEHCGFDHSCHSCP